MSIRDELLKPIPTDGFPIRFHSLKQVEEWHIRRVIADSYNYTEAARRLGITTKTLWRSEGFTESRSDPSTK